MLLASSVSDAVWANAFSYLAFRIPSLIAETISAVLVVQLVSWGKTKTPLLVFGITAPLNLLFDCLLIYGLFFFPELGVNGAALGSTIAMFFPLAYLWATFNREKTRIGKNYLANKAKANYQDWAKISLPAAGSALVDYAGAVIFAILISLTGVVELAAMRFAAQLHLVIFIIIASFSGAILYVLGSQFSTVPETQTLAETKKYINRVYTRVGIVTFLLVLSFGGIFGNFISPDAQVMQAFYKLLVILLLIIPFACVAYANITLQRLAGVTVDDFRANFLAVWAAQIPIALLLLCVFGGVAPFVGLLSYWVFRAIWSVKQVRGRFDNAVIL